MNVGFFGEVPWVIHNPDKGTLTGGFTDYIYAIRDTLGLERVDWLHGESYPNAVAQVRHLYI